MGQAYLESFRSQDGNLILNVVLVTNDGKIPHQFTFPANVSRNEINAQIQDYLDHVTASEDTAKSLQLGLLDLTVTPPPPPPDPPKDDAERKAFREARALLRRYLGLVADGIIDADNADLIAARKAAVAAWNPAYIDGL